MYCEAPPERGRARCRIHGGATPTGRDSPHFIHGRDSHYSVPFTAAEQDRYEQYLQEAQEPLRRDLLRSLALAQIQRDRAVAAGGSGVAESGVIARLALAQARVLAGKKIEYVVDRAQATRFNEQLLGVFASVVKEVVGENEAKRVLALGAQRLQEVDWSTFGFIKDDAQDKHRLR